MGVSKVIFGSNTLIDLTSDTVSASNLLAGETAHGADGEPITGTMTSGMDLSDLEWSSRSTTYTEAVVGKKYLILVPTNATNEGTLVGCTKIWSIRNYSNAYNAYLFYVEATATTIRVQNQGDSGYRHERVALIE